MAEPLYDMLSSIPNSSLTDKVYQMLRQAILERKLLPGEKLNLDALAKTFNTSRTPVTYALKRLAFEGLVEIKERKKTSVINLTPEMIQETCDLRRVLEVYAAEQAVKFVTKEELSSLRDLAVAMERETDYSKFLDLDRRFHESFIQIARNKKLNTIYQSLHVHSQVMFECYLRPDKRIEATLIEHRKMIELLEKRQLQPLIELIKDHIELVKGNLLKSSGGSKPEPE